MRVTWPVNSLVLPSDVLLGDSRSAVLLSSHCSLLRTWGMAPCWRLPLDWPVAASRGDVTVQACGVLAGIANAVVGDNEGEGEAAKLLPTHSATAAMAITRVKQAVGLLRFMGLLQTKISAERM